MLAPRRHGRPGLPHDDAIAAQFLGQCPSLGGVQDAQELRQQRRIKAEGFANRVQTVRQHLAAIFERRK